MKKIITKKKSGFSLVELAIVIIIIGLLISGVMGGAELIKSAQLRSVIREQTEYQTAVAAFRTKFEALPGDYSQTVVNITGGNDDGKIMFDENSRAWVQLKEARIISAITAVAIPTNQVAPVFGADSPISKTKGNGWVFCGSITNDNKLLLSGKITADPDADLNVIKDSDIGTPAVSASDAKSIDDKLDDGVQTTGRVTGISSTAVVCAYTGQGQTTTKRCAMSFELEAS